MAFFDVENISEFDSYRETVLPIRDLRMHGGNFKAAWGLEDTYFCSDTAKKIIRKRWQGSSSPAIEKLSQSLLQYTPCEIISSPEHESLLFISRETDQKWEDYYILPEPNTRESIRDNLNSYSITSSIIEDFFFFFGGMRYELKDDSGAFAMGTDQLMRYEDTYAKEISENNLWNGSVIIYYSLGGHAIALHPSGRTAWINAESALTYPMSNNFEDFLYSLNCIRHSFSMIVCDGHGKTKMGNVDFSEALII